MEKDGKGAAGTHQGSEQGIDAQGAGVHGHYVAIGPYDFIDMLKSPKNKTVARVFLGLGSQGTVHITSPPTIPVDEFITRARK